ncbi:hypothetical protein MMC34_006575 [Xylographa carneopallida]|nr:hypothetical protein [Xylographa carneopallida]
MPHRRSEKPNKRARHGLLYGQPQAQPIPAVAAFFHRPALAVQRPRSSARVYGQTHLKDYHLKSTVAGGPLSSHHYFSNGTWCHPSSVRESRYSDFVPCTHDEQTLLSRLYKYALAFLSQTNSSSSSQRTLFGSRSQVDIEMITSSPSPTLHATSPSPRLAFSHPSNGQYRYPAAKSPRPYIKPPSPAAFPSYTSRPRDATQPSHKRSRSQSTRSSQSSSRQQVDAGTQYSPPLPPSSGPSVEPSRAHGKRKERSQSPPTAVPPPEPRLAHQMTAERAQSPPSSSTYPGTASSTTLANSVAPASSSSQGSSPKRARPPKSAAKIMPARYETCDVKDLVLLISNMLMELIRFNDEIPLKDGRLTRFHSRAPPGISVVDYLQRLTTHATLSPPILLSMVYYIDRLCALYPAFTISSLTVHRFLIASATVASKGLSDSFWTNNTYARVGGVSLKELALLELEFLWRVEWRIVPKPEVLIDYYRSLVERSEGFEVEVEPEGEDEKMSGTEKEKTIDASV